MASTKENFDKIISEMEEDNSGVSESSNSESSNIVEEKEVSENKKESQGDLSYPHLEIMDEEGISKKDLPIEIRKMITTFDRKMLLAKRHKSAEKTFLQLQNLSTLIADKIIDYIESDTESSRLEDGGGISDADTIFTEDGGGDVEDPNIEDDEFEEGGEVETKEKGGIFGGILGGIFDY